MTKANKLIMLLVIAVAIGTAIAIINHDNTMDMEMSSARADNGALQQARQRFWQRDIAGAEAQYRKLASSRAATADIWGELGNIYYLQAKWPQAAEAYTEATLRLLDGGNFPQAMFMRNIVARLDVKQLKRIDEHWQALQQAN